MALVMTMLPLLSNAQSSVALNPVKDNTIYYNQGQTRTDSLSNGAGAYLVAGNVNTLNYIRRALIKFDLSTLPSTATVDSVVLKIHAQQNAQHDATARYFSIYRLTNDWGEGTSNAGSSPGTGTYATDEDATWKWNFYDYDEWNTDGGDFNSTISATTDTLSGDLLGVDVYWRSAKSGNGLMATNVQNWIAAPATNYGWIIKGIEGVLRKATMFYSRESSYKPVLTVYYH